MQDGQLTAPAGGTGARVVWVCICYSNGKIGHSLRAWELGWASRLSVFGRDVRIGELIGRYRTLEPFLLVPRAFDADGTCTFCTLVTAMLHPHSLARTGG